MRYASSCLALLRFIQYMKVLTFTFSPSVICNYLWGSRFRV